MKEWLSKVYWGNTIEAYLFSAGAILLVWILLRLIRKKLLSVIRKLASGTHTRFDDLIVDLCEKFVLPYLYLLVNFSIAGRLNLSPQVRSIGNAAFQFITAYFLIRMINYIIHRSVVMYMERKGESSERVGQLSGILLIIKVISWIIGLIMLADNLGYDVTTLLAGFGVGGIAIALAAQNILGDLFSYLVIFFDKPFETGDFIVTGNYSGVVEKIGIKTTHVRSLDGQQLIMPNAEMAKSVIQNFKRLERRRVVFTLGVIYQTPAFLLRQIPAIVRDTIGSKEMAGFDRVHLVSFGDSSINYEIVYYVESSDFLVYRDLHHAVCLDLFEAFEQAGIEFAYPTQTVFINKNGSLDEVPPEQEFMNSKPVIAREKRFPPHQ